MKTKMPLTLTLGGLAIGLVSLGLLASPNLAAALGRYPHSVLIGQEHVQFNSIGQSSISRQANYHTPDALLKVRRWYVARYQFDPESEKTLTPTGDCIWMRQSTRTFRLEHTIALTLCAQQSGTRISINESVYLYP